MDYWKALEHLLFVITVLWVSRFNPAMEVSDKMMVIQFCHCANFRQYGFDLATFNETLKLTSRDDDFLDSVFGLIEIVLSAIYFAKASHPQLCQPTTCESKGDTERECGLRTWYIQYRIWIFGVPYPLEKDANWQELT
jgi:hypothetical protein